MRLAPLARLTYQIAASNLGEIPLPYRLTYAVTNRCQARCAMCNIWQKPAAHELTLSEIATLFTKTGDFSWINLTGGELFQRPDITDILLTVVNKNHNLYLLNFPTNGIQTDEIISATDMILHKTRLPRLIISVSIDGPGQLHDSIRGIEGSWGQALTTFCQLRQRQSKRFTVFLGYTVQSANLGKFSETLAACRTQISWLTADDFHVNLAHLSEHYYANADLDALPVAATAAAELAQISAARQSKAFEPVAFIERRYQEYAQRFLKHGRVPLTCQAAAASCFIDPAGIVYPCSVYDAPLGSLREYNMDLYDIWYSAKRSQIRHQVLNNACPGCWTPCEAYQTILANLIPCKDRP